MQEVRASLGAENGIKESQCQRPESQSHIHLYWVSVALLFFKKGGCEP